MVLGVLPSMLGFAIAAFALLLATGDEKFRVLAAVIRPGSKVSTLQSTSNRFFNFILTQLLALLIAMVASGRPLLFIIDLLGVSTGDFGAFQLPLEIASKCFRFLGFLVFCYSLTTVLAAAMNLRGLARSFSKFATASVPPRVDPGTAPSSDPKN
ncbi:MAG: hypothetical protein WC213_02060 [Arenimonas sp.]|jgi:hypothetical protein